jgi:hypothetical protein
MPKNTRAPLLTALLGFAAAALGTLLAATPALAHHSFSAEFDSSKPVSLRGVVTKVELISPHSWITIDVKDAAGQTASWMVEGGSPNVLLKSGVTKTAIPLGSELVIDGYQARDGSNRAVGRSISFADGRPLFFAGSKPDTASAK